MSIGTTIVRSISRFFTAIQTLLYRDSERYDIVDFRVGTLIGTAFVGLMIPIINQYSDLKIIDNANFRYGLVIFQLILVFLSYQFEWAKRNANELGNLCSLIYGIFCVLYAYQHEFTVVDTAIMLIALFVLCGMFKNKLYLRFFIIIVYVCLGVAVFMSKETATGVGYVLGVAAGTMLMAYYTFSAKINIIAQLTESQESIRLSEQRFRSIFDNAPLGIVLFDSDFQPTRINQYFVKEFGYSEAEIQRRGIQTIVHPQDLVSSQFVRREIATSPNGTYEREQRFFHKSGEIYWVRVSMSYVQMYAQSYLIGMFDNITREKNAELALQETSKKLRSHNEALEEFSYVISHDLQEPLRMITSFSQIIQRKHLPKINEEGAYNDFAYVIDGAKRMSLLIRDMLEYSRWSAKDLPLEEVNTKEVLSDVMQNLIVAMERSEAVLICENFPVIRSNKMLLRQVLQNLISNSIKYRQPDRPLEIDINITVEEKEILFSIADNGRGFEERDKERIFGIFQRLDTDKMNGNGMGLAICKRVIEKQGGTIWAEGVLNEGATFYFTLPVVEV